MNAAFMHMIPSRMVLEGRECLLCPVWLLVLRRQGTGAVLNQRRAVLNQRHAGLNHRRAVLNQQVTADRGAAGAHVTQEPAERSRS